MGPTGSQERKKIIFSKVVPRPLGMLKPMFLVRFEPVVTRFGPWKIPKCLENGPFWEQKWVQNGSKMHFLKSDPGPFGMLKQVFLAHSEPVVTHFGPWKIPKCLEKGQFWDQKWVKNLGGTNLTSRADGDPKTGKKFHCWPVWPTVKLTQKLNFPKLRCGGHIS